MKILVDVANFRLRRLEMANLFAAVSIMAALRLPSVEGAYRLCFGVLLNLLVYLHNDCCDIDQDLSSEKKNLAKTRYLAEHRRAAQWTQIVLIAFLAVAGFALGKGLLLALVAGGGICYAYSSVLKRIPYLDVLAMILAGALMPLIGLPLDRALGWLLVAQLALFSGCFQSIQLMRDHSEDVVSKIKTTAVLLGLPRTRVLLRLFIVISAAYACLFLNRYIGVGLLAALFIPIPEQDLGDYWNRIRLVTGLCWLGMVGWVFWFGSSAGWITEIDFDKTIAALTFIR